MCIRSFILTHPIYSSFHNFLIRCVTFARSFLNLLVWVPWCVRYAIDVDHGFLTHIVPDSVDRFLLGPLEQALVFQRKKNIKGIDPISMLPILFRSVDRIVRNR